MLHTLSQIPRGSFIGDALRFPLRLIPKRAVVTVRSGLNRGMKWIAGSSTHGCWLGTYEWEKQQMLGRRVKPGMKVPLEFSEDEIIAVPFSMNRAGA